MTLTELTVALAKETGLPKTKVARLLRAFFTVTRRTVMSGEDVTLRSFGTFYSVVPKKKALFGGKVQATGRPVIRFKEARMDKYGVQFDDEKTKTGSKDQHCPECGRKVDPATPNYCEECGTRPFEKKPEGK